MKSIVCKSFGGSCNLSEETCARRHQKATFDPNNLSLEPCRKCPEGKKAFEAWKNKFNDPTTRPARWTDQPAELAKKYTCKFCGGETASADLICLRCHIEGKDKAEPGVKPWNPPAGDRVKMKKKMDPPCKPEDDALKTDHGEKGVIMVTGVTSSKKCLDCGRDYKPTSNVQKRCPECQAKHKIEVDKAHREKIRKTKGNGKPGADKNAREKFPLLSKLPGNGAYTVTVDFARLPKLHKSLLAMSDDEIRTPGDQLLYLLKNTLEKMEASVS